jgi:hypothetical protein
MSSPFRQRTLSSRAVILCTVLFTLPGTGSSPAVASQATLIATTDTSQFSPPSPDPAGIAYLPASDSLLASDSEIDEIPQLFTGDNLFEMSLSGLLLHTLTTVPFSSEPTGVALNPQNGHLFFSDDSADEIFELDPGPDGLYGTPDDTMVSLFDTRDFLSFDPEGGAYAEPGAQATLFIADGIGAKVFSVTPGPNGVFDGVAPAGDDEFTSFDTAGDGFFDIEGIDFDPATGHLYIVGRPATLLGEYTTEGVLVRLFDLSAASPVKPAGLTLGPGSLEPQLTHLYISDRGIDNSEESEENDGRVYEMSLPDITAGNGPPQVDAGDDQTITLPASALLDGSVFDDGIPNPPGFTTTIWRQVSGAGTVSFADENAVDTVASFDTPGIYVLRLAADDDELVTTDDVILTVLGPGGESVIEAQAATGSDDAEERFSGSVATGSVDLEMVSTTEGGGGNQVVGLRFPGVSVPQDSGIIQASIQFQADESDSEPTVLTIHGEATDDALAFAPSLFDISSRPKTLALVSWSPPAWNAKARDPAQKTPDISPIIQEIVDRSGWSSGNALTILIDGEGKRVAESADGDPSAPLLRVEFIPPPCPDQATLSNLTVIGLRRFRASTTITVGPGFVVAEGGRATFRAGDSLVFVSGFSVLEDGEMEADVSENPCD